MSATEHQFRGVAFGGFNRQDVLAYLENTFSAHNQQIWDLKHELEQAEESCARQTAALAEAELRQTQHADENSELSAALADAQERLAKASGELADARSELAALRERVGALEPDAEAFIRIKDRAASIEMEAHLRAQSVLDEAKAHAQASRERVEAWLSRVQSDYDRLRTDVDATVSHASGELERIQRSFDSVSASFDAHDDVLTALMNCCREETDGRQELIGKHGA